MINYFISVWSWITDSALHKILFLFVILVVLFLSISKYPITFELKTSQIQDMVEVDKDTVYVIHSEFTKEGAKLSVTSNSYFTKMSQSNVQ